MRTARHLQLITDPLPPIEVSVESSRALLAAVTAEDALVLLPVASGNALILGAVDETQGVLVHLGGDIFLKVANRDAALQVVQRRRTRDKLARLEALEASNDLAGLRAEMPPMAPLPFDNEDDAGDIREIIERPS